MSEADLVPTGTEEIRLILMGTRNAGSDNDSYFDDMFLKLNLNGNGCEQYTAVGIRERLNNKGVAVYPNPFSHEATIEVVKPTSNGMYSLTLFDRAGRTVQSMKSSSGKFTISAEGLTSGMYFYQVTDGDWISTGKVVMR
jgi:hypothetical protein